MKRQTNNRTFLNASLFSVAFAVASLGAGAAAFAAPAYKTGTYQLDAAHSKVGFEIPHLVISTVEGRFNDVAGTIELAQKFEASKATVTAQTKSIDTGVAKRDDHLRSGDFFDAAKFPEMKFVSTAFKGKPEAFKVTGNLTIKGVTKPVSFDAKYLGAVADGYGNEKAAFSAKAKISRKDFGLTWNNVVEAGPVVGDEVTIELKLQAAQPLKK